MEKLIINLICELEDSPNESKLLNLQKRRLLKYKNRNLLLQSMCGKYLSIPKVYKVVELHPDDIFFDQFRSTFQSLMHALKPFWVTRNVGRCPYSLEQSLYITLWKLSNGSVTYRQISERFNIAMATAHKIFYKTIRTICCLKKEIAWPSIAQQQLVMEEFQKSRENPFPHVVGCVDVTQLKIPKPKLDEFSYYNRRGFYSINVQAICDSKFRFLDVFIGYPGSCHDTDVWKNSPIYKSIERGQVQLAQNAVILGDSAYPISKFLLTPFRDNGKLSREQKKFNCCLNSTRISIDQSFEILKSKFRMLDHLETACLKSVSEIVFACIILHNFILNKGNPSEYIPQQFDSPENSDSPNTVTFEMAQDDDEDGISLRNHLTTVFSC